MLDSDDSDQERDSNDSNQNRVPSPPSPSPPRDLSGASSPGPDFPQQVPVPVPPRAANAERHQQVDMIPIMQACGGPGLLIAARGLDAKMPDSQRLVPSVRAGGETRRETLKRKANDISRSSNKIFAFCTTTSETVSQGAAAKLLSAVGNVSRLCIVC